MILKQPCASARLTNTDLSGKRHAFDDVPMGVDASVVGLRLCSIDRGIFVYYSSASANRLGYRQVTEIIRLFESRDYIVRASAASAKGTPYTLDLIDEEYSIVQDAMISRNAARWLKRNLNLRREL